MGYTIESKVSFRNPSFILSGFVLVFIFLIANFISGTVMATIFIIVGVFNWRDGSKGFDRNYIIFLLLILFYNAFDGDIFGVKFNETAVSIKLSNSANSLAGILWLQILFNSSGNKKYLWTVVDTLLLIYVVWFFICSVFAYDFDLALGELARLPAFLSIYFFTRRYLNKPQNWVGFLNISFISLIVLSIISIYKLYIGESYGTLGKFMFFVAPLVFLNARSKNGFFTLNNLVVLFSSATLLVAESRRILVSLGIIWLFSYVKNTRTLIFIIPFLFMLQFFLQEIDEQGGGRYTRTYEQIEQLNNTGYNFDLVDNLSTGRASLWAAALGVIVDNPISGVGPGNLEQLINLYGDVKSQRAHNIILDIAGQLGVVGLLIFIGLNYQAIKSLSSKKWGFGHTYFTYNKLARGIKIGLIVILSSSLFGGSMLFDKFGWVYYGAVAALIAVSQSTHAELFQSNLSYRQN